MIVDVAVPVRVSSSFHYLVDSDLATTFSVGSVVEVPFGSRKTHAFVLGFSNTTNIDPSKLKAVRNVLVSEPLFDALMLKFLRWIAEYYCHPIGEVIAAAVPKAYWEKHKISAKPKRKAKEKELFLGNLFASTEEVRPKLTNEQEIALAQILDKAEKKPFLLHGVTGSGKTEVYMRALESILSEGKNGIVLVPEIALTPLLMNRFIGRFGGLVAVLHSDLTPSERFTQWELIRQAKARIVVGARSAIFAPLKDLGLIIVDEEHETSFKQEDSLRYHGRDIAVVRGHMSGAKVILGSATPSLESYANAKSGKYVLLTLKNRVLNRKLPKTVFIDLKEKTNAYSFKTPWLSRYLVARIEKTISNGQQVLLYLNRLGFAHFLFCKDCGHTWRCKNCDVALTYYKNPPSLKCHYCGVIKSPPLQCEECQGNQLESLGLGTEQVEKNLKEIFPKARIGRMDRGQIKGRKDLESILSQISKREIDIVIGTQMVAKGHDFPGIALVGILVADASLNIPDFRANERTFQIITQVSGRAGRAEIPGEVVIQTVNPDHPVLTLAAQNRAEDFYRMELDCRRLFGFPPCSRMAMLRFQHVSLDKVEAFASEVSSFIRLQIAGGSFNCSIIGPSEAPLSKIKKLYRWQCLVKSESVKELQKLLNLVQTHAGKLKSSVQMAVDVDPMSSM